MSHLTQADIDKAIALLKELEYKGDTLFLRLRPGMEQVAYDMGLEPCCLLTNEGVIGGYRS